MPDSLAGSSHAARVGSVLAVAFLLTAFAAWATISGGVFQIRHETIGSGGGLIQSPGSDTMMFGDVGMIAGQQSGAGGIELIGGISGAFVPLGPNSAARWRNLD